MTHDPETAERLAAILTPLITEQSCGEWDDKTINEDVQMFLPPLLAALQEARNAALCEAAEAAKGEGESEFFNPVQAIRALIDTPAPPAEPAGDAQPITMTYRNWCGETGERTILPRKLWFGSTEWHPEPGWLLTAWDCDKEAERVFSLADCQFAALAAAPDPGIDRAEFVRRVRAGEAFTDTNPEARWIADCEAGVYDEDMSSPQPDADEREAMVTALEEAYQQWLDREDDGDQWFWHSQADALLADGWTRKREEG